MNLKLFSGSANPGLAQSLADCLGLPLGLLNLQRFPDGELQAQLQENVRGCDVYLLQSTSPPVAEHLLELELLADACRRAGAARLTAVIPYFGYARQDRRTRGGEAVGARLVADLLQAAGVQRVVVVDPHTTALEGFFSVAVEQLSAAPLLAQAMRSDLPPGGVVVAPDLGAVKLAERYGAMLGLPLAIVHKSRVSGVEVRALRLVGEVTGAGPVVVDDMISTGGTIQAAVAAALTAGSRPEAWVAATHALLVGPAVARLQALPLQKLLVTDSVRLPPALPLPLQVVGLGPLLATAVRRLHEEKALDDLTAAG